jgi:dienelactone hydrolase
VLVLPGFGAGDTSTASLRGYLTTLGYRVRGWGLGINRGNVPTLMRAVVELLDSFADSSQQPVALVGWSLGGVLAREAARERPRTVQQVITMGSPIIGGPRYSVVAPWFARQGFDFDAIERRIEERERTPIEVPITAIYSRRDGVVAWQACLDRRHAHARNVEVFSTHTGLGFDPDVYRIVASRLGGVRS